MRRRATGAREELIPVGMGEKEKTLSEDRPVQPKNPMQWQPSEDENPEATVDQDPGERQKRNQGWQREDPLAS